MKSGRGPQEEEDEEENEELSTKKEATPSTSNMKDVKNSDKANATRSKHSVTEQRRRSKINERFQILRELIPNSDQKRDTASFLLEVIQYVQYLQEKVQKYEGTYQTWGSEPTKLMPWRNSHWRMQSFVGQPQAMKTSAGTGPTFPGRFEENAMPSTVQSNQQNPVASNPAKDMSQQNDLVNKAMAVPMPMPASLSVPAQNDGAFAPSVPDPASDTLSAECPIGPGSLNHQEELTVEGGTISISSVYSQGLLNSLTQALQSSGIDLSQATISVQINLGKRANRDLTSGIPFDKDNEDSMPLGNQSLGHFSDTSNGEDLDHSQKRLKI